MWRYWLLALAFIAHAANPPNPCNQTIICSGHVQSYTNNTTIHSIEFKAGANELINNGLITNGITFGQNDSAPTAIINNGSISFGSFSQPNGTTKNGYYHFYHKDANQSQRLKTLYIKSYNFSLNTTANIFNSFAGASATNGSVDADNFNSHIVLVNFKSVKLAKDSLILDLGPEAQFGERYKLDNFIKGSNSDFSSNGFEITDESGRKLNNAEIFDYIKLKRPIYKKTLSGDSIIFSINGESGIGNTIFKNNLSLMNSMISKSSAQVFGKKKSTYHQKKKLAQNENELNLSSNFKSNSKFYYDSARLDSNAIQLTNADSIIDGKPTRRRVIKRQTRKITRVIQPKQEISEESSASFYVPDTSNEEDYVYQYFFSPFVSHSVLYSQNDSASLSGLDYGFVGGFNNKLDDNTLMGLHLGFSYGGLKAQNEIAEFTNSAINTMGILGGLHYKLEMPYDIFMKVRGDVAYFINNISYLSSPKTRADIIGYGAGLYVGKDFNFTRYGILGFELGANYQGSYGNAMELDIEQYAKSYVHLVYADVGANYYKLFSNDFGINALVGGKILAYANNISQVQINNNISDYNIAGEDYIAYVGAGLSYMVNDSFELALDYLGNFGLKKDVNKKLAFTSMNNSGFFNMRLWW